MLKHVDLCSGIGGFALGFNWAGLSNPILFCDVDPFCREVLAKNFPGVDLADDVKELVSDTKRLVPDCDILTAGYPCQPFSLSGKRKGEKDERHIWPYIRTILEEKRPA
jgi:DNA (cytosine-5)-methyltransferase 1